MSTLTPRDPYSPTELGLLYPPVLQLEQVQVLMRHGERTPTNSRFRNAGLSKYWPYCKVAQRMRHTILNHDGSWDEMVFRRKLETFDPKDDSATFAQGPGETDVVCLPGELTDKGRATTLALGERLRTLYVDQLKFLPSDIESSEHMYLRATPIPRALESLQQTFHGLYPVATRLPGYTPPVIVTRSASDETLFPNEGACRRLAQLSQAFAERTALRWNTSAEMSHLNAKIGKWMPDASPVAVDSHPRLSGIMDTVNSTLAHGPETRLPSEFYDDKSLAIINKISVEEWFSGYTESTEYRRLGIGGLVGDVVARMVEKARAQRQRTPAGNALGNGQGVRFGILGCHDTTLASLLTSLGAFEGEKWPPYTSHVAVELFRHKSDSTAASTTSAPASASSAPSLWTRLFGSATEILKPAPSSRTPIMDLAAGDKEALDGYYVRLRFNDKVMTVPACREAGKHFGDDASMCTLEAFKAVADKYTPRNWKSECGQNLDQPAMPTTSETAGY